MTAHSAGLICVFTMENYRFRSYYQEMFSWLQDFCFSIISTVFIGLGFCSLLLTLASSCPEFFQLHEVVLKISRALRFFSIWTPSLVYVTVVITVRPLA